MAWQMPTPTVSKNEFERPSALAICTIFLLASMVMLLYGVVRATPTLDERVLGRQTSPRLPEPDRRYAANETQTQDPNSVGAVETTTSTVPLKAGVPDPQPGDRLLIPGGPRSDRTGAVQQTNPENFATTTTRSPTTTGSTTPTGVPTVATTSTTSHQPLPATTRPAEPTTTTTHPTAPTTITTLRQMTIIRRQTTTAQDPILTTGSTTTTAPPNRPPLAEADLAYTNISTTIEIDVLANDSDPDEAHLRVSAPPTSDRGASITVNDSGTILYTPNPQSYWLAAKDTIAYTVTDSAGQTATAQVTVTISPGFIQWSSSSRQNPSDLYRAPSGSGLLVSFFPSDLGPVSYVQFRIDGELVTTEQAPFYDLGGSSGLSTADDVQPFSVADFSPGTHEISARTVYSDGRTTIYRQNFVVE